MWENMFLLFPSTQQAKSKKAASANRTPVVPVVMAAPTTTHLGGPRWTEIFFELPSCRVGIFQQVGIEDDGDVHKIIPLFPLWGDGIT